MLKKDPKNIIYNYLAANMAIILNEPEETVRICEYLDPELIPFHSPAARYWFSVYSYALTRLNRIDEALDIINHLPEEYEDFHHKPMIYALRNQEDSIKQLAERYENRNPLEDASGYYLRVAMIYAILEDKPKQLEWAEKALQILKRKPESVTPNPLNVAQAYYLTEQYDEALSAYIELSKDAAYGSMYNDQGLWNLLSRIGCIYAKKGETKKALEMIEELKIIPDPQPEGRYSYAIARIHAQLNNKEKAMEYLQRAFKKSFDTDVGYRYHDDIEMQPLYGYPPFEKFVKYRHKKIPED